MCIMLHGEVIRDDVHLDCCKFFGGFDFNNAVAFLYTSVLLKSMYKSLSRYVECMPL